MIHVGKKQKKTRKIILRMAWFTAATQREEKRIVYCAEALTWRGVAWHVISEQIKQNKHSTQTNHLDGKSSGHEVVLLQHPRSARRELAQVGHDGLEVELQQRWLRELEDGHGCPKEHLLRHTKQKQKMILNFTRANIRRYVCLLLFIMKKKGRKCSEPYKCTRGVVCPAFVHAGPPLKVCVRLDVPSISYRSPGHSWAL